MSFLAPTTLYTVELASDNPSGFVSLARHPVPRFTDLGDLNALSIVVQDLSLIYDVSAVAVLPGCGQMLMPDVRFGPRRWSPLRADDRRKVGRISLASPLAMVFDVAGLMTTVNGMAVVANRVLVAVKTWQDILAAGLDIQERERSISENRRMAPSRLREGELSNNLLAQQVRRATAEADIVEAARDGIVIRLMGEEPTHGRLERVRHTAASLSNAQYAQLLEEPIQRLLGYSGGEIEISGSAG
jgi:hypothetical protein